MLLGWQVSKVGLDAIGKTVQPISESAQVIHSHWLLLTDFLAHESFMVYPFYLQHLFSDTSVYPLRDEGLTDVLEQL